MKQVHLLILIAIFTTTSCSINQTKDSGTEIGDDKQVTEQTYKRTTPDWAKDKNIYEVNIRQYSEEGTFKGFKSHLPRLKEMGVDILWFMPVNPIGVKNRKGTMGSYYSVRDYKAVNPEFGTLDEFKALVDTIHEMGMYVLIDWVANHTAWDHIWTESNPDFYTRDSAGNFAPPVEDWSDVIDLNYENKEVWGAMIDALKFWLTETNIDGFRCDVADMVPVEFWNQVREELDKVKPVFMLAEAETPELHEKAFDMSYGWRLMHTMNDIASGNKTVSELDSLANWEKDAFPEDAYRMRFTTNHDENSWNGTAIERYGDGADCFAVLCVTLPGMPLIYSGQEAGLNKRIAFFEKDPVDWTNYSKQDFYTKLLKLKKENPALWNGTDGGKFKRIDTKDHPSVYAYSRTKENNKIVVLLNLAGEDTLISFDSEAAEFTNLITGETESYEPNEELKLQAWEYKVLLRENN